MTPARAGYTLLLYLALPLIALRLVLRAIKQPNYLRQIGERIGRYDKALHRSAGSKLIWVHAVSVGETRAAQPLEEMLLAKYAQAKVLVTYMTPTGRETGEALFADRKDRILHAYLPYDYPFAVSRFLDHFRPHLGLIMETELWFNLLAGCSARKIPMLLVNGRLSQKSTAGYAHVAGLAGDALKTLFAITAQSEADAARFRELGAENVLVAGNIKFDMVPDPELVKTGTVWRRALSPARQVMVAANTRDGEEALILEAYRAVPEQRRRDLLLVMVPRHPQRFNDVAALIEGSGFGAARRGLDQMPGDTTQLWLGDTMGEMTAYYAMGDLAFIGGSLLPLGAHNLIEACAIGIPVLIGPHTFNFAEATDLAIACGAAVRVENATALMEHALSLLDDAAALKAMAEAGARFAEAHRGATKRTMALIAPLMESDGGKRGGEREGKCG